LLRSVATNIRLEERSVKGSDLRGPDFSIVIEDIGFVLCIIGVMDEPAGRSVLLLFPALCNVETNSWN
jgi:hypothetical protein